MISNVFPILSKMKKFLPNAFPIPSQKLAFFKFLFHLKKI